MGLTDIKTGGRKNGSPLPCKEKCLYNQECGTLYFVAESQPCTNVIGNLIHKRLSRPGIDAAIVRSPNNKTVQIYAGARCGSEERIILIPGETRVIIAGDVYKPIGRKTSVLEYLEPDD